jgi:septal ring factor EnvC (AmiA/AmiB activator)
LREKLSELEDRLMTKDAEVQMAKEANVAILMQEQEKVIELEKQLRLAKSENAGMSGHINNKQKIQQHMQLKRDIEQQAETIKQLQEQIIHITVERDHAKAELKRISSSNKVPSTLYSFHIYSFSPLKLHFFV